MIRFQPARVELATLPARQRPSDILFLCNSIDIFNEIVRYDPRIPEGSFE
jgi:hypothetical protein